MLLSLNGLSVDSFYPLQINVNKTTNITIKGKNFPENITCMIKTIKIPHYFIETNDTLICEIPANVIIFSQKIKQISLTLSYNDLIRNKTKKYTLPKPLNLILSPELHSLLPSNLPSSGGTLYLIGDNFSDEYNSTQIVLDDEFYYNCVYIKEEVLSCYIPSIPLETRFTYNIRLIFGDYEISLDNKIGFYGYYYMTPNSGPVEISTNVISILI